MIAAGSDASGGSLITLALAVNQLASDGSDHFIPFGHDCGVASATTMIAAQ